MEPKHDAYYLASDLNHAPISLTAGKRQTISLSGTKVKEVVCDFRLTCCTKQAKIRSELLKRDVDNLRHQYELALKEKQLVEEKNCKLAGFFANMGHEIRTPLNAIVGFSNLIVYAETEEERLGFLKIIESSNETLLKLINDLLDFSKIEAGYMEFVYADFSLDELCEELEAMFALRAAAGVKVIFECDHRPKRMHSDKTRIKQVLANFLSNAVKHTASGAIRFGYRSVEKGIYLYVSDTGSGISSEQLPRVFDRFVMLDKSKPGTGLGLSICTSIVEHLHGLIGVESEPGKGSTFWCQLPVRMDMEN